MAIARKPKIQSAPTPSVNVDALIAKGGGVARSAENEPSDQNAEERVTTSFTLRVPNDILIPLDAHRKKQSYKVPRQQWIIEAIMQRLEREMLPHAPKDD